MTDRLSTERLEQYCPYIALSDKAEVFAAWTCRISGTQVHRRDCAARQAGCIVHQALLYKFGKLDKPMGKVEEAIMRDVASTIPEGVRPVTEGMLTPGEGRPPEMLTPGGANVAGKPRRDGGIDKRTRPRAPMSEETRQKIRDARLRTIAEKAGRNGTAPPKVKSKENSTPKMPLAVRAALDAVDHERAKVADEALLRLGLQEGTAGPRTMTPANFTAIVRSHADRMVELLRGKNADYGGDGDALKSFRKRGLLGLLVRIEDKLNRYETFLERGAQPDEWRELLSDLAGYALCGLVVVDEASAFGRVVPDADGGL
jgi:hypothetical protein